MANIQNDRNPPHWSFSPRGVVFLSAPASGFGGMDFQDTDLEQHNDIYTEQLTNRVMVRRGRVFWSGWDVSLHREGGRRGRGCWLRASSGSLRLRDEPCCHINKNSLQMNVSVLQRADHRERLEHWGWMTINEATITPISWFSRVVDL